MNAGAPLPLGAAGRGVAPTCGAEHVPPPRTSARTDPAAAYGAPRRVEWVD